MSALGFALLLLASCTPMVTVEMVPVMSGGIQVVSIAPDQRNVALEVRPRTGPAFKVPPGHFPPRGMCRAWFPGRPPGHQPPPGQCADIMAQASGDVIVLRG